MRRTIRKTVTVITSVQNEHYIMAGAYGAAGVLGHGTELLLVIAYITSGVVATHLVHLRKARRHAAAQRAAESETAK